LARILVVDDDRDLGELLRFALGRSGHDTIMAHDVAQGLAAARDAEPDAAIVDVNLPDGNGFDLARRIRVDSPLPIIMLTTRGSDDDQITGFDAGADDYVSKPFNMTLLIKRINALLRRVELIGEVTAVVSVAELHGAKRRAHLTPTEARLRRLLLSNRGRPVATDVLADRLWGAREGGSALVKSHMYHLRRKLGLVGVQGEIIETVPGVGYKLVIPSEP
jgi:DNA-binding response OmpR family regulator